MVEPIGSDHKGNLLIFEVRIGDILVFATDGFFDNVLWLASVASWEPLEPHRSHGCLWSSKYEKKR